MSVADAILIAVAGFLAGGVNAVAGGGSLISFPALVAIGLPPLDANVTNTTAVWPGYLGSAVAYREELVAQRGRLRALVLTALAGGLVGSVVLLAGDDAVFDTVVPFLVLAGSILLALQPRIAVFVAARKPSARNAGVQLHVAIFLAAVYGAYFGGGLGVILLAVLGIYVADHLQRLNALKSALSLLVNTVALIAFALFGPVDWLAVAIVAPASLLGGYVGARMARRLSPQALRSTVVVFGVVVAIWLFLR